MNTKLITMLSVLCLLLLGTIAAEWFYAKRMQQQTLAALKVADKKSQPITQMPTIALNKKPEQSFVDMVTRPLFIKGRRPAPELPADVKSATAKPTGPFTWQLNGVYSKDANLYALLSRATRLPKGNFRKITKGSDLDGWLLTEIMKDKVILNQGGVKKELLLRKPKPKTITPNKVESENPSPNNVNGEQPSSPMQPPPIPQAMPPGAENQPVPEPIPGADGQVMPDGSVPDTEAVPEPEPEPMPDDQGIPEPEQDFQTDQSSEDTSTFENGTNEQF